MAAPQLPLSVPWFVCVYHVSWYDPIPPPSKASQHPALPGRLWLAAPPFQGTPHLHGEPSFLGITYMLLFTEQNVSASVI